jgi:hypothetical protein
MSTADTAYSALAVPASLPQFATLLASSLVTPTLEQRAAQYLQDSWRARAALRRSAHLLNVIQLASHVRPEKGMLRRFLAAAQRHSLSNVTANLLESDLPHIPKRWSLVQVRANPAGRTASSIGLRMTVLCARTWSPTDT